MRITRSFAFHTKYLSKRIITISILTIATIAGLSSLTLVLQPTKQASAITPPDTCFAFNSATGTITDYYNNENNDSNQPACPRDVDIPSQIGGVTVTEIGNGAFYDKQLTSVTFPNSITSIGFMAFEKNQLSQANLPSSLVVLGEMAFADNRLSTITIPGSLTTISESAFYNNYLTSVSIGQGVASIGYGAFAFNKLTEVTIPSSVTSISPSAFTGQSPWGGAVHDCIDDDGGGVTVTIGDEQILGAWTSDTAPCLFSDDLDEAKVVLDNIWYVNLTPADSNNSNNHQSGAIKKCFAYDDDPDNPECTVFANSGGHIVSGAKLNLHYIDQTNNSLRTTQTFVGRLDDGSYITNYYANQGPDVPIPDDPFDPTPAELSAINQVLSASYFQIGDTVTIDPPIIAGYITPPVQTFLLGSSINDETYVYAQGAGDGQLAETGMSMDNLLVTAGLLMATSLALLARRRP